MQDWHVGMRRDLYTGTAEYYHRFRVPYSDAMVQDLRSRAGVSGDGRMADLGCGTGQVTFKMHRDFADIWAIDQEVDSIQYAEVTGREAGISNVRWIGERVEDFQFPDDFFDLVGIGNAFHRLGRRGVAKLSYSCLRPGGYLALLWVKTPATVSWSGPAEWQESLASTIADWIARAKTGDRFPDDKADVESVPHQQILEMSGFKYLGEFHFPEGHVWTVESLTGLLRSTSYLSEYSLGSNHAAFEHELRQSLMSVEPSNQFHDTLDFHYQLARKPLI